MNYASYAKLYKENLLQDVIPFWQAHSRDVQHGGYFTCLDVQGNVYDRDKFIWLQCRQVWCFAMLYNRVEQKQEWFDFALEGASFLEKFGRDVEGNWYFSLTQDGQPLIAPYNIFSDCFATMAFAQLHLATGNAHFGTIAVETFYNILKRQESPKGAYSKAVPGTRVLQSFSLPMILCNLVLEMEHLLPPDLVESTISKGIASVMEVFYQKDLGLILEHVGPGGTFVDCFEGRLINPGHGLEALWFVMDLAKRTNDAALIQKAVDVSIAILEYSWDPLYDGIFYFMDCKGYPPQQLEWNQKLWWVHVEALVCLLKGFYYSGDPRCWKWFKKVHDYTWKHFPDQEHGEWYGYLDRRGEVLLPLKGGKWKGCFHVPRALYQGWKTLEALEKKYSKVIYQENEN